MLVNFWKVISFGCIPFNICCIIFGDKYANIYLDDIGGLSASLKIFKKAMSIVRNA